MKTDEFNLRDSLSKLAVARVRITMQPQQDASFARPAAAELHDALAAAMKEVSCILKGQLCTKCMVGQRCHYSLLFEEPPDTSIGGATQANRWSPPFVIDGPPQAEVLAAGEEVRFHLLLCGRAGATFPQVVAGLERIGARGPDVGGTRLLLTRIDDSQPDAEPRQLYDPATGRMEMEEPARFDATTSRLSPPSGGTRRSRRGVLHVGWRHPLILPESASTTPKLPFAHLIDLVTRRVNTMLAYHAAGAPPVDWQAVHAAAQTVHTKDSDLTCTDTGLPAPHARGLAGTVTYTGESLAGLMPLLTLGSLLHVGPRADIGMGAYEIT